MRRTFLKAILGALSVALFDRPKKSIRAVRDGEVRYFPCYADGVHDDTKYVQAAFDWCEIGYTPSGSFNVSHLSMHQGTQIRGAA